MKLYIAYHCIAYDGDWVTGIFDSEEKANQANVEFANKVSDNYDYYYYIVQCELNEPFKDE